jgi:hypothetical protein
MGSVVRAQHAVPLLGSAEDVGPNNERLEDVKPELVNALRELVRQYRQEGIVARRHEIRRIRQARLFWKGLQYAWWNPNDMNWHLTFEQRFSGDRALEEMPRYQFVTNFYQGSGCRFVAIGEGTPGVGGGGATGKVYLLKDSQSSDDGTAIPSYYTTHYFPERAVEQSLNLGAHRKLFSYLTLFVEGAGNLSLTSFTDSPSAANTAIAPAQLACTKGFGVAHQCSGRTGGVSSEHQSIRRVVPPPKIHARGPRRPAGSRPRIKLNSSARAEVHLLHAIDSTGEGQSLERREQSSANCDPAETDS